MPLGEDGRRVTASPAHIALSRRAAAEGMVLLENRSNTLPLAKGTKVALFGTGQADYVRGGGGSGEVTTSYTRSIYQGFQLRAKAGDAKILESLSQYYQAEVDKQYAAGAQIGQTQEVEIPAALLAEAVAFTDTAVIVIKRFSGEGYDRKGEPHDGDFYLSENEETMVKTVVGHFAHVIVVLDVGGIVDTAWFKHDNKIGAVLMAGQAGIEGGLAVTDVLLGDVNPSGKLADTYAGSFADYPSSASFNESQYYVAYNEDIYVGYRYFETIPGAAEKVNYEFGYGLSYTTFALTEAAAKLEDNKITASVKVTNTGSVAGREVVQVYYSAPQGVLGKPAKVLAAFGKTGLLQPGESQTMTLCFAVDDMASYDDTGKLQKSAYVLEQGEYAFYIGDSVRKVQKAAYTYSVAEPFRVVRQMTQRCQPFAIHERMKADGTMEPLPIQKPNEPAENPANSTTPKPTEKHMLADVAEGKLTLDEFIAQLSDNDLIELCCGQPNTGVANTYGIGNLPEYGVPNVMTADGPAGLRIQPEVGVCTTAWPVESLLASSWDTDLMYEVGKAAAEEVKENNIGIWLAPALNIHRNPLCGRNFEYISEDPLVAGKMAAAEVRGVQSQHVAATPKHFACNDKETNRTDSDSRLSERALREIYLHGFEIVVKEADPWAIMTSYNIINGRRTSENYDLITGILRGEWGYKGMVMTDWWNRASHINEVKAGNDVKMAHGFRDELRMGMRYATSRGAVEACAKHVLEMILKLD
jgi:beta-glucosidase